MATRTIESPGVEWNEYDLSQVVSYAGGTVVVVMGFAHQGPTNQVVEITSKEELMSVFFGSVGPQNAAERYFYHSGLEILNTPGKLLCIRLPYGSGKGSGFSTGYTATVFYGETVMMTSAQAVEKFIQNGKGTGLTPAYFKRVWEDAGVGDTEQPVVLINPEPESFVISEELYEEIKDGALEDGHWIAPEYNPVGRVLMGYSYSVGSALETGVNLKSAGEGMSAFYGEPAICYNSQTSSYDPEVTVQIDANTQNVFLALDSKTKAFHLFASDEPLDDESENPGGDLFEKLIYLNNVTGTSADDSGKYKAVGVESDGPDGVYYLKALAEPYFGSHMSGSLVDALGKSVFFTVNKTESSVDQDYAGFYLTVCDQDAFVRRGHDAYSAVGTDIITDAFALCLDDIDVSESATSAYSRSSEYIAHYLWDTRYQREYKEGTEIPIYSYANAVAEMERLNKIEGDAGRYTVYVSADEETGLKCTIQGDPLAAPADQFRLTDDATTVPARLRNFALNGTQSLSQSCVDSLPYVFSKPDFANALHIGVHRFFTNLENDKLSYATLEAYTGSLNPDSTIATKNGGKENYGLARMTENHSAYIDIYTNPFFEGTNNAPIMVRFGGRVQKDVYSGTVTVSDDVSCEGVCVSLGGYRSCSEDNENEYIGNLPAKIDNALLLIDSVLDRDIDIVIDGGLSTIWAYTYGIGEAMEKTAEDATSLNYDNTGYDAKEFDENRYISKSLKNVLRKLGTDAFYDIREACAIRDSVYSIFTQFNVFCSKTRKDCIYISDPPRFFFVHGEDTKASSKKDWVFSLDMYHPLKNIYEAANTSYAATYMNWVKKYDNTLADFIWLPMSPFAAAIMCEVDAKYFMWWAPFGLNNGVLSTITDIAFRPNQGQCDYFYKTGFNPVCFFNDGGYVIWGQKTLLDKHSAFDRINVRRLFLYLERRSMKAMRWFIGEPNTQFTRTQVLGTLRPMYDYCVNNSGLYDYLLKCDEENNPPDIIDDNTLVVDAYLKPVRTIEFILLNFYATRTSADFSELIG